MTKQISCQGQLLAANPVNPADELCKAVILVLSHNPDRAIGIQINSPLENLTLQAVAGKLGIDYTGADPIWSGGPAGPTKIHVIHSMDWAGLSTVQINEEIGVTSDVSVIAALSRGDGPEHFRACSGFWIWEDGHLDRQLDVRSQEPYTWELSAATRTSVFQGEGNMQWLAVLEDSAQLQIDNWF